MGNGKRFMEYCHIGIGVDIVIKIYFDYEIRDDDHLIVTIFVIGIVFSS